MKIALINDTLYPYHKGGAPKRVWKFAKGLLSAGHEPHIFSMNYKGTTYPVNENGVIIHGVCPVLPLYENYRRKISQALRYAWGLQWELGKWNLDAVYCTAFPVFPAFVAKDYCMDNNVPLILDWYEFWEKSEWLEYLGRKGYIGYFLEKWAGYFTKWNIADGDNVALKMRQHRVYVHKMIPDGVDVQGMELIDQPIKEYDVVYLGALLAHKNVELLINACAKGNYSGLIIGDGCRYNDLVNLAHELKANVDFAGSVYNDFHAFRNIKKARVFVHPSLREGCGLTYVEAMACKLPVVSVLNGNVVVDEYNGYICKNDVDDMVNKIRVALLNNGRLSEGAFNTAQKNDWSNSCIKLNKIIEELVI